MRCSGYTSHMFAELTPLSKVNRKEREPFKSLGLNVATRMDNSLVNFYMFVSCVAGTIKLTNILSFVLLCKCVCLMTTDFCTFFLYRLKTLFLLLIFCLL